MRVRRSFIIATLVAAFCAASPARAAPEVNDECSVPPALAKSLEQQWRGWKILHIADLTAEDQNLWTYARGRVCPGVSPGHFLGAQSIAYALAIIRGGNEAVSLAGAAGSGWKLSVVVRPVRVKRFRVIWTAKPGTYADRFTGAKTEAKSDAIGFEELGGDVTIFVPQKGHFIPVRTAQ